MYQILLLLPSQISKNYLDLTASVASGDAAEGSPGESVKR